MWTLSCTYAKRRGVRRSHFELRTNFILAFFCMYLCCGWVHWHLLCPGWGETSGCPTLWGCSMVCIGKNIASCSKNPQFLPVMCALCLAVHALCTHAPRCGGGGGDWRSAIFRNFPQFFRGCFSLVPLACVLVPCMYPVQKCCFLRLREVWFWHHSVSATFLQFSCNFPAIFPQFFAIVFDAP